LKNRKKFFCENGGKDYGYLVGVRVSACGVHDGIMERLESGVVSSTTQTA